MECTIIEKKSIDWWISDVRMYYVNTHPEMLSIFEIYAAEAIFGRYYISEEIDRLQSGAEILEIGAGSFLLSCQLVREGFKVTALEPVNDGFSHLKKMRQIILKRAEVLECVPQHLDINAEELQKENLFDFAFSVNVMEHVDDPFVVTANVIRSLTNGSYYRFCCPNYFFPYEPHFNIPTLFSKRFTETAFMKRILSCKTIPDPIGMWKSLNWINVVQVRKNMQLLPGAELIFNRRFIVTTLERLDTDPSFADRRSPVIRNILAIFMKSGLHKLFRFTPLIMQPVMDCQLRKIDNAEVYSWRK